MLVAGGRAFVCTEALWVRFPAGAPLWAPNIGNVGSVGSCSTSSANNAVVYATTDYDETKYIHTPRERHMYRKV